MLAFGTQVRGFETRPKPSDFSGRKSPQHASFGGEVNRWPHVADLRHVKDPYSGVEITIVGKSTGDFSPIVPLSLLEVSRVVVDVGAPGGASGKFQSIG
jgi:hypothetical protein